MRRIPVIVDSHLRLPDYMLEYSDICENIYNELTIPNKEKAIAKRMKRWEWWELPDEFYLYDIDGDELILPRGYALQLKWLLRENGIDVQWVDRRQGQRGEKFKWRKPFKSRDHQVGAVAAMKRYQQGMYEAPTGSGKSLTCVKFIHDTSPEKTLILTDQTGLLSQWITTIDDYLLGPNGTGRIGGGKWLDSSRIVVGTLQSIWSAIKKEKIDDSWFNQFDCVFIDECHHVPASTVQHIVSNFPGRYRIGVSATADRQNGKFEVAQLVLGEVFHTNTEEELLEAGVLVKPHVEVIKTRFEFPYWGDHDSDKEGNCDVPKCRKRYPHSHRNNFQALKTALTTNQRRAKDVCNIVLEEYSLGGKIHLVVSNEIRQLDVLEYELQKRKTGIPIYRLTGESKGKKRMAITEEVRNSDGCIVLATVAKEGLDIPNIDRIYLPFPDSNPTITKQKIGRGTRISEGKDNTIIYDFVDPIPVLKKQFRKRRYGCYDKLGLEVIM